MHRKQDSDLFPADTELERTLRSLRKTKRAENVRPKKFQFLEKGQNRNFSQKSEIYSLDLG